MERFSQYYEELPSGWESWMEGADFEGSFVWSFLGLVISIVIFSALGALGGIIGIALFGKKKSGSEPEGAVNVSEDTSHRQS